MCRFISGEVARQNKIITVYFGKDSDSHTQIRLENNMAEDTGRKTDLYHTSAEFIPTTDLFNPDTYRFVWDVGQPPEWFHDDMLPPIIDQFKKEFHNRVDVVKRTVKVKGNLYLCDLTTLQANAKLTAGGSLNLNGLTTLPANAKLTAGSNLYLSNLTTLPSNNKLIAGGNLYLCKLTTLPSNHSIKAKRVYIMSGWVELT